MRAGFGGFMNAFYALIILFPCIWISNYILYHDDKRFTTHLFVLIVISLAITGYTTYRGCLMFPNISREMATGTIDPGVESSIRYMNVGGFNTIYIFVLMLPLMIAIAKNKLYNIKIRVLSGLCIISLMMGIIQSEYTTALLLALFALTTFFIPANISFKSYIRFGIIALVGLIIFRSLLPPMLEFIADVSDSVSVQDRLNDMAKIISGEQVSEDSDADVRLSKLTDSFDYWVQSPIWGNFEIWGGHSYLGNVVEYFGLIGFVFLLLMLKQFYRFFVSPFLGHGFNTALFAMCTIYISLLIFNPQAYLVVPMLMLPICGKYMMIKNDRC